MIRGIEKTKYTCGIDLHKDFMDICVIDGNGDIVLEKSRLKCQPKLLIDALEPYKGNIKLGVESSPYYYWIADLCNDNNIIFYLGDTKQMKYIHKTKQKNDRLDSRKIAQLLNNGFFPTAYVYPRELRQARDLVRQRAKFVSIRSNAQKSVKMKLEQSGYKKFASQSDSPKKRAKIIAGISNPLIKESVQALFSEIANFDQNIFKLEHTIKTDALSHFKPEIEILQSIPGLGDILSSTILYEIGDISRFPTVQNFTSYCLLNPVSRESANKYLKSKKKEGGVILKTAFWQLATSANIHSPQISEALTLLTNKHRYKHAVSILSRRLASSVYFMLKNKELFNIDTFIKNINSRANRYAA